MKIRINYVSNSSSSSFLLIYRDESVFDFLKSECEYYDTFISGLKSSAKYMYDMRQMVKEQFEDVLSQCEKVFKGVENVKLDQLAAFAVKDKKLILIIKRALKIMDSYERDDDEFAGLRFRFADTLIKRMNKYGDVKIGYVSYADEDGEYWGDMEHEFMWGMVVNGSTSHDYEIISKSKH